jgi:proton-translocating NAD(P)+ transhydrogenase subunit beta
VQNPLFFHPNTQMLFGDAKTRVEDILRALGPVVPAQREPIRSGARA